MARTRTLNTVKLTDLGKANEFQGQLNAKHGSPEAKPSEFELKKAQLKEESQRVYIVEEILCDFFMKEQKMSKRRARITTQEVLTNLNELLRTKAEVAAKIEALNKQEAVCVANIKHILATLHGDPEAEKPQYGVYVVPSYDTDNNQVSGITWLLSQIGYMETRLDTEEVRRILTPAQLSLVQKENERAKFTITLSTKTPVITEE